MQSQRTTSMIWPPRGPENTANPGSIDRRGPSLTAGSGLLLGALLVVSASTPVIGASNVSASITIVGNGEERHMMEQLGRAFQSANPGNVVEIRWDPKSKPIEAVESGTADIAVAGRASAGLAALPIAWDGIAIIVHQDNSLQEVRSAQLVAIFSEQVKRWTELQMDMESVRASDRSVQRRVIPTEESDAEIHLIHRARDQSIRQSFEETLGIANYSPRSATVVETDQQAINEVAANISAVAYASFAPVFDAIASGASLRVLQVDFVGATERAVVEGRYPFRRQILLLSREARNVVLESFFAFTLSEEGQAIVDEQFIPYSIPIPSLTSRRTWP